MQFKTIFITSIFLCKAVLVFRFHLDHVTSTYTPLPAQVNIVQLLSVSTSLLICLCKLKISLVAHNWPINVANYYSSLK